MERIMSPRHRSHHPDSVPMDKRVGVPSAQEENEDDNNDDEAPWNRMDPAVADMDRTMSSLSSWSSPPIMSSKCWQLGVSFLQQQYEDHDDDELSWNFRRRRRGEEKGHYHYQRQPKQICQQLNPVQQKILALHIASCHFQDLGRNLFVDEFSNCHLQFDSYYNQNNNNNNNDDDKAQPQQEPQRKDTSVHPSGHQDNNWVDKNTKKQPYSNNNNNNNNNNHDSHDPLHCLKELTDAGVMAYTQYISHVQILCIRLTQETWVQHQEATQHDLWHQQQQSSHALQQELHAMRMAVQQQQDEWHHWLVTTLAQQVHDEWQQALAQQVLVWNQTQTILAESWQTDLVHRLDQVMAHQVQHSQHVLEHQWQSWHDTWFQPQHEAWWHGVQEQYQVTWQESFQQHQTQWQSLERDFQQVHRHVAWMGQCVTWFTTMGPWWLWQCCCGCFRLLQWWYFGLYILTSQWLVRRLLGKRHGTWWVWVMGAVLEAWWLLVVVDKDRWEFQVEIPPLLVVWGRHVATTTTTTKLWWWWCQWSFGGIHGGHPNDESLGGSNGGNSSSSSPGDDGTDTTSVLLLWSIGIWDIRAATWMVQVLVYVVSVTRRWRRRRRRTVSNCGFSSTADPDVRMRSMDPSMVVAAAATTYPTNAAYPLPSLLPSMNGHSYGHHTNATKDDATKDAWTAVDVPNNSSETQRVQEPQNAMYSSSSLSSSPPPQVPHPYNYNIYDHRPYVAGHGEASSGFYPVPLQQQQHYHHPYWPPPPQQQQQRQTKDCAISSPDASALLAMAPSATPSRPVASSISSSPSSTAPLLLHNSVDSPRQLDAMHCTTAPSAATTTTTTTTPPSSSVASTYSESMAIADDDENDDENDHAEAESLFCLEEAEVPEGRGGEMDATTASSKKRAHGSLSQEYYGQQATGDPKTTNHHEGSSKRHRRGAA